jgi:prepilin-type N-terminal cleavage/methylation domain-containing protein
MKPLGFTLVEMVVSIVILAIIAAVGASIILGGAQAYYATTDAFGSLSKLRYATARITTELRQIGVYVPALGGQGCYQIPAGTTGCPTALAANPTSSLGYTTYANFSAYVNGTATAVAIAQSGNSVNLSVGGTTSTLMDNVSALTFTLLQANGANATDNINVAFIDVDLRLTTGEDQHTRVWLRNLP